jgi:hypothetical protein
VIEGNKDCRASRETKASWVELARKVTEEIKEIKAKRESRVSREFWALRVM